jgi:phytoene dehydrogenase-like protein
MDTDSVELDVAVIGGGLAGLTAACYLARAGRTVTILEQAPEVGGRAATQQISGFAFNRGAHALYSGGSASHVLGELGVTYGYGVPTSIWVFQHGRLAPFPTGLHTFMRTSVLRPRDKLELVRVLARVLGADTRVWAGLSVQTWIERASAYSAVRHLLSSLARPFLYTTALDLVSAEVFVAKLRRALTHPIHYVDGGWQTLVDGLCNRAVEAGARILTGCGVADIEHAAGRIRGLHLRDGRYMSAAAVVIATPPRAAVKLFGQGYAPLRTIVERLVPAHVACLDVALHRLPAPRYAVVQDMEKPRFMTAQSQYARIAPADAALIHVFKQHDPRRPVASSVDEHDLEGLLDAVQPGWRDLLLHRVFLPHIEAVSALPLASTGGFAGRPCPQVPGLSNGYLAGDWVGDEGFLADASMASARAAAQAILGQPVESFGGASTYQIPGVSRFGIEDRNWN